MSSAAPSYRPVEGRRRGGDRVRFLSYNLNLLPSFVGYGSASGHGFKEERFVLFAEHLGSFDILALQEVFSTPFLPRSFCRQRRLINLARARGLQYCVRPQPQPGFADMLFRKKFTDSGLLILSRFRVIDSGAMAFVTEGADLDRGAMKGCLFALLQLSPGHNVAVFNCHLQATHTSRHSPDGRYETIRERQLRELRTFLLQSVHRTHHSGPVILTGDFNVDAIDSGVGGADGGEISSVAYRHLKHALCRQLLGGRDLLDLLYEQEGRHPSTRPPRQNFPSTISSSFSHRYPQRLDYVFWDPGDSPSLVVPGLVTVRKFTADRDQVFTHLSDHYGLQVELRDAQAVDRAPSSPLPPAEVQREVPYRRLRFTLGCMIALAILVLVALLWPVIVAVAATARSAVGVTLALLCVLGGGVLRFLQKYPLRAPLHPKRGHLPIEFDHGSDTLAANWRRAVATHGGMPCFGSRPINRQTATREQYVFVTYNEVAVRVADFGAGLARAGVRAGDRVALWSEGRRSWAIADLACSMRSFVSVAIPWQQKQQPVALLRQMLKESRCKVMVCNKMQVSAVLECCSPYLNIIVQMQDAIEFEDHQLARQHGVQLTTCAFVESSGKERPSEGKAPAPGDLCTIMFSQNSQGRLCGVGLTHENIMWSVRSLVESGALGASPQRARHFSHLPTDRTFERVLHYSCHYLGIPIGFSQAEQSKVMNDLRALRPSFVVFEPPALRRVYDDWSRLRRQEWRWARRLLFSYSYRCKQWLHTAGYDSPLLNQLVFSGWRDQLGGRVGAVFVTAGEQLERRLRIFSSVVFCAPAHTVVASPETGLVLVSLRPLPGLKVRLDDLEPTYTALSTAARGVSMSQDYSAVPAPSSGEVGWSGPRDEDALFHLLVSGPGVRRWELDDGFLVDPQSDVEADGLRWLPTGLIVRQVPAGEGSPPPSPRMEARPELEVIGRREDVLRQPDTHVLANVVERCLRNSRHLRTPRRNLIDDVFVTCEPNRPLVAVMVADQGELAAWIRERADEAPCNSLSDGSSLSESPSSPMQPAAGSSGSERRCLLRDEDDDARLFAGATPLLLRAFERVVSEFSLPDSHVVRGVYLHTRPFASDGFCGTHPKRQLMLEYFGWAVAEMYSVLAATASECGPPPAHRWLGLYGQRALGQAGTPDRGGRKRSGSVLQNTHAVAVDIGSYVSKLAILAHGPHGVPAFPDWVDVFPEPLLLGHHQDIYGSAPVSPIDCSAPQSEGPAVFFARFATPQLPRLVDWLASPRGGAPLMPPAGQPLPCCGGAAERFAALFRKRLGRELVVLNEVECFIRGLHHLLRLDFTQEVHESLPPSGPSTGALSGSGPSLSPPDSEVHLVFPYLAVSVGSGVSIFLIKDAAGSFERVAGSSIGGGTFWGLCKLLTRIRTWDELDTIRQGTRGDNTRVDLLVGETHVGCHDPSIGLRQTTVASSFGRVGRDWSTAVASSCHRGGGCPTGSPGGSVLSAQTDDYSVPLASRPPQPSFSLPRPALAPDSDSESQRRPQRPSAEAPRRPEEVTPLRANGADTSVNLNSSMKSPVASATVGSPAACPSPDIPRFSDGDVAASLMSMVGNNIAHVSYLTAQLFNAGQIYFCGGFVSGNHIVQAQLTNGISFWSKGAVRALFLHRSDFLSVFGAMLLPVAGGPRRGSL